MTHNLYELSILVNGRPIREYGHRGLTYVEGRKDQTYSIRFRNNSSMRVLAIISVDGIGIVDGKPATAESRGYVVPAYASAEFKGWRKSLDKIHDFVFDPKSGAYSAQTQGTDRNCGIVSVKVFGEDMSEQFQKLLKEMNKAKPKEWHTHHHHHHYPPPQPLTPTPLYPYTITSGGMMQSASVSEPTYGCKIDNNLSNMDRKRSFEPMSLEGLVFATSVSSQSAPVQEHADFNLGTAWGAERDDAVAEVEFKRASELATLDIYYSDEEGLKKAGIEVSKDVAVAKSVLPKGFNGFCTPPPVVKQ